MAVRKKNQNVRQYYMVLNESCLTELPHNYNSLDQTFRFRKVNDYTNIVIIIIDFRYFDSNTENRPVMPL